MKSLEDFIKEEYDTYWASTENTNTRLVGNFFDCEPPYLEFERRNKFLNEFYKGEECPENVLSSSKVKEGDYILEMLNTHSVNRMIERIKKEEFKEVVYISRVYNTDDTKLNIKEEPKDGTSILVNSEQDGKELSFNKKFINIIDYFNYYVTLIYYDEGCKHWFVMLEPRYSKRIKNIEERNYGKAYHVTTQENWKGIRLRGLRTISQSNYRYYPERIYLILPNTSDKDLIKDIIRNLIRTKGNKNFVVLEVNLRNFHGNLYEDVTMNTKKEHYVYTYENIPARLIKDITYRYKI